MEDQNSLKHYGVLGMKWGIRRSKEVQGILGNRKKYGSRKQYKQDLNKARVKAANRLYSRNSKEANRRIATRSMGKTLVRSFLLGSYGSMKLDQSRAKGVSRGKAVVTSILKNWGNNISYGTVGMHEYYRNRGIRKSPTGKGNINAYLDKTAKSYNEGFEKIKSKVTNKKK